jgi:CRISPR-associated protein Cas2
LIDFRRISKDLGYEIYGLGDTKRDIIDLSGLKLVIEKVWNQHSINTVTF